MYPKTHAITAAAVTTIAALINGINGFQLPVWILIGTTAGVMIDVDHALLGMTIGKQWNNGVYWFKHPIKAITQPDAFLDDMDYQGLIHHRILSHFLIFTALIYMMPYSALLQPAIIGLGTHILGDIGWDLWNRTYLN